MFKIVINSCYGGFGLSKKASEYLNEKYNIGIDVNYGYLPDDFDRHDKRLIEVVEKFGDEANGFCAKLEVVETESRMYRINEYDGYESIETPDGLKWVIIND